MTLSVPMSTPGPMTAVGWTWFPMLVLRSASALTRRRAGHTAGDEERRVPPVTVARGTGGDGRAREGSRPVPALPMDRNMARSAGGPAVHRPKPDAPRVLVENRRHYELLVELAQHYAAQDDVERMLRAAMAAANYAWLAPVGLL